MIFETSITSYNRRSKRNYLSFLQVSCLSIILRQKDLAFIKAISTLQPSPALLRELRTALALSKKKRKMVVSAGSHGTTLSGGHKASQDYPSLNAGKRKAIELVNLGGSTEYAKSRPAPGAGSAPLPAFTSFTKEQAASGTGQLGHP